MPNVTQSIIYDELMAQRERLDVLEEKIDKVVEFIDKVEATLEQMGPMMAQVAPLMQMVMSGGVEVPQSMEGVNVLGKAHD